MKVLFFCYRSWAITAVNKISNNQIKKIIISNKKPEKIIKLKTSDTKFNIEPKDFKSINTIINKYNPQLIILVGWSNFIKKEVYDEYETFCLHPSDLPKYRGGSPLQHQILDKLTKSKMTLFKVNKYIDGGAVYKKIDLSLKGNMVDIFKNLSNSSTILINSIINDFLHKKKIKLKKQILKGSKIYKRRRQENNKYSVKSFKKIDSSKIYNLTRSLERPYPNLRIYDDFSEYKLTNIKYISENYLKGYKKIKLKDKYLYFKFKKV